MRPALLDTLFLRVFSFSKIPLLFAVSPRVVAIDSGSCEIAIPFKRNNKNHLGSMYFGTLCIGADAAGGLIAMKALRNLKNGKGSLIFKDFQANFLKRAEGETRFVCRAGEAIREAVNRAYESGERVEIPVPVTATVPSKFGDDPVAEFVLTLSLKVRRS